MFDFLKFVFYSLRKDKKFFIEPFIYIDEYGRCSKKELTNTIRWLEKLEVVAKTEKEADKKAFEILNKKYPQYKGGIWIL